MKKLLALCVLLACSLTLNFFQLRKEKKHTQMVEHVLPILEEMDTTYSLRNYEVQRVKLYNCLKEWRTEYDK